MALPITPTPTLTGKDAENFISHLAERLAYLETPEGKEAARKEIKRLKALYEELKPILKDSGL